MVIYLGADHRGFELKELLKKILRDEGYEIEDAGAMSLNKDDDYPDFARGVAERVSKNPDGSRGILVCGSGAGMDIVANKFRGVRSVLAVSTDQVYMARHDDNVNVLSLAAGFLEEADVLKIMKVFLSTPFGGEERHKRRLDKISQIESTQ